MRQRILVTAGAAGIGREIVRAEVPEGEADRASISWRASRQTRGTCE
jgi:NAD(P)-dependent dehydrogenase (short-subunit alcohol dehydrogenase family)